jgi:hypothetical protein
MCDKDNEIRMMKELLKIHGEALKVHTQRLNDHQPIVSDYGNRNLLFRVIGVIALLNLILHLIRGI